MARDLASILSDPVFQKTWVANRDYKTNKKAAFYLEMAWTRSWDFKKFLAAHDPVWHSELVQYHYASPVINNLKRAGACVRRTARQSIRKVSKTSTRSKPGEPPRSHRGTLREGILYDVNPATATVIVGPIKNRAGKVPHILEFGGRTKPSSVWKKRIYQVGQWGPVDVSDTKRWQSHQKTSGHNENGAAVWRWTVRRRLVSEKQARRATHLWNEILHGGRLTSDDLVTIEPRPYMRPALEKNRGFVVQAGFK
ncbi:MAG: hypothetical protein Q4D38_12515 [Planctomycetia bacterium]|nr:hypothetical protein [Planctomycetia bacterium]